MKDLNVLLKDYAALLIKEGLNIQKGQRLMISCPVSEAYFAHLCTDAAYEVGCKEVIVRWSDDYITRATYLHGADEIFDTVNPWSVMMSDILSEEGAGWLAIHASDPENLKGVDPDRIRRNQIVAGKAMEKFRQREMRNEFPWCVCSIPTKSWAKKVFPELSEEEAVSRLWEEILSASRVDGVSTIENWQAHSAELQSRVQTLNNYNFKTLRYKNSLGTDLVLELPENHFWAGGAEKAKSGISFSANIPTEEIFTLPKRDSINGTIYASKPLVISGNIVDKFYFVVKDGKIVEAHAEVGEEFLLNAISVDEGASYFGEVALVPYDSPISNSGILFYNTLFDENASCHFAFGEAYPCLKDADSLSEEELKARGVNFSMTHDDFMVGTADLSIIGTTHEGKEVVVFENGNFAF